MALGRIGGKRIDNIDAPSDTVARDVKFWLENCILEMGGIAWNCLMNQADLAQEATGPSFGYTYRYKLPNRCIKVFRVNGYNPAGTDSYYTVAGDVGARQPLWAIYNGYIHTDDAVCRVDYTRNPENTSGLTPQFNSALACLMASYLSTTLRSDKGTMSRDLRMEYERVLLPAAMVVDGNERNVGPANVSKHSKMLGYRRVGTRPNANYNRY